MFKDASVEVPYEKSVLSYQENGKYGIIDFQGNKITDAIYDEITSLLYKEGCLLVKQDNQYGVINNRGKEMVKIEYDSITADGYYDTDSKYQKAGFIVGKKKEEGYRYGYIDNKGQTILEENYNEVDRITEITENNDIYLLAFKNGQAGIYQNKKQIIPHTYEDIEYNKQNNLFLVEKNEKQGVKDRQGNEILAVEYDYIMLEENSLSAQKGEESYRFDLQGKKQEIQNNVTLISTENSDYSISINSQDKFGIVDHQGKTILENEYTYIEYAFKDYFILTKTGSVSVLDAKNRQEMLKGYDVIQKVENKNVLQAIQNKPYTVLLYNETMEKIASLKEASITSEEQYIKLISRTDRMYFDNTGNAISYQDVKPNLSLYAFKEKEKWGFKNKEGIVVIAPNYDMVTELNPYGYAGIRKGDKWGVIDEKGNVVVEPSYEIEWEEPEFIGPYCKLNFGYGMVYYTKELTKENTTLE